MPGLVLARPRVFPALRFGDATSDRVTVLAEAALNDLADCTYLALTYRTGTAANLGVFGKNGAANVGTQMLALGSAAADANTVQFVRTYATTNANAVSATDTSFEGRWEWICGWLAAADQIPHLAVGTLTSPLVETGYNLQTTGAGALSSDAANDLVIGNTGGTALAYVGSIAAAYVFNRVVSLAGLRGLIATGLRPSGCVGAWRVGANGRGVMVDESGAVHHGLTMSGAVPAAGVMIRASRQIRVNAVVVPVEDALLPFALPWTSDPVSVWI